jgi:L-threonylcarbamoyladenylate synthase
MPIVKISDESIREAAAVISSGGLVAFPTETVYGLGGDAYNSTALARIFEVKGRPCFDPLIVHIADIETLEKIADLSLLDATTRKTIISLTETFWPGPLTLILPKRDIVPDLATSGLPTVAVRLPAHDVARKLIAHSTGAVAAPSANPFGYLSPTRAGHVADALGKKVEIVLDGGQTQFGLESTVLDISGGSMCILRPGAITREAIESIAGPIAYGSVSSPILAETSTSIEVKASPGLMKSHYAPRIPLCVYDSKGLYIGAAVQAALENDNIQGIAVLFFNGASRDKWLAGQPHFQQKALITVLSETGNLIEAAARLFETLHNLERLDVKQIYAQLAPEEGLGTAINDRLRRAATNGAV